MARTEVHALYVALADKGDTGRQAVGYISGIVGPLGRQGIAVDIYRIRPKDLRDPRVLEALRRRGIDRLPAALARGRPLVGLADIRGYYEAQLAPRPGARAPARGEPAYGEGFADDGGSAEEDLDNFFREEMRAGRPDEDLDGDL